MPMDELKREVLQQREVNLMLFEIDKRNADFVAQRSESRFLGHKAEINRGHVEPRCIGSIDAQLAQLLGR